MSTARYFRMFGYAATLAMHIGNIVFMNFYMGRVVTDSDSQLKAFGKLQPRYFTCWTFFLQTVYAAVGLISDYKMLVNSNNKNYKQSKYLIGFKKTLFSAIVWPSTWVVFTVFWSLFIYDRNLIFPPFLDKVITPLSNHIMHTAIIGVVLWEICFQPREVPRSHKRNLYHLSFHLLLYISVLTYTYIQFGNWLYPIFNILYGTIYFPLLLLSLGLLGLTFYYIQWPITEMIWGRKQKAMKIR